MAAAAIPPASHRRTALRVIPGQARPCFAASWQRRSPARSRAQGPPVPHSPRLPRCTTPPARSPGPGTPGIPAVCLGINRDITWLHLPATGTPARHAEVDMATGADWRVGEAEREAVAGQLREHYAAGRLNIGEFRAKLDAAYSAATASGLSRVTADLPAAAPSPAAGAARGVTGAARPGPAPGPARQR